MSNQYEVDNVVRTRGTFKDEDGTPRDPLNVQVIVTDPDGNETTYVYLTHPEVIKEDVGIYRIDLLRSTAGTWSDKWQGWDDFPADHRASKSDCFEMIDACST